MSVVGARLQISSGNPSSRDIAYTWVLYRPAIGLKSAAPSPFFTKNPWSYSRRLGVPVTT